MIYWLNRKVEQAVAGLLSNTVPGDFRVYRSADLTARQFPCAVVRSHQASRFGGQVHAAQLIDVTVTVMTEFARVVDSSAELVKEFEEQQESVVSSVLEVLYVDTLAADLTAIAVDGISFSMAQIGDGGSERPVIARNEEDGTVSMVEIPLQVVVGAVEE